MRRLAAFLLAFGLLAFGLLAFVMFFSAPAQAGELEKAVAALAVNNFKSRIEAVKRIAGTGDSRAVPVLEALVSRRLYIRKADTSVVIVEKKGSAYVVKDPLTLIETGEVTKKEIKIIRVNNRLRGIIRGALGGLTLFSKDPAERLAAADAVFKTRAEALLPILEKAHARETVEDVRLRMGRALAALRAVRLKDTEPRLAAIRVLSGFVEADIRALLGQLVGPGTSDPKVRSAAAAALKKIEDELALWATVGNI